jgi:hypothetical protein
MLAFHALTPAVFERVFARRVDRNHFEDRPVPSLRGNLFEPMPEWTGVSGGWKRKRRGERAQVHTPRSGAAVLAGEPMLQRGHDVESSSSRWPSP